MKNLIIFITNFTLLKVRLLVATHLTISTEINLCDMWTLRQQAPYANAKTSHSIRKHENCYIDWNKTKR